MADEELRLLEAIEECGIGNWYVTGRVESTLAAELKRKCEDFYFHNLYTKVMLAV